MPAITQGGPVEQSEINSWQRAWRFHGHVCYQITQKGDQRGEKVDQIDVEDSISKCPRCQGYSGPQAIRSLK